MPHQYSIHNTSDSKSETHESEQQCRGLWIPIDILQLLEEGTVSSTDVMLLALIDSYVKVRGEGCWVSHGVLASKLGGLNKNYISDTIKKLAGMKLIFYKGWKITNRGRYRLLETKWSRINTKGVSRKTCRGGVQKNLGTGVQKNLKQSNTESNRNSARSRTRVAEREHVPSSWCEQTARTIYKRLKRANKITKTPRLDTWIDEIRKLVQDIVRRDKTSEDAARKYIKPILEDHLDNIKDKYQPQAWSAPAIRNKWPNIEAAYRRRLDISEEDIKDRNSMESQMSIYDESTW